MEEFVRTLTAVRGRPQAPIPPKIAETERSLRDRVEGSWIYGGRAGRDGYGYGTMYAAQLWLGKEASAETVAEVCRQISEGKKVDGGGQIGTTDEETYLLQQWSRQAPATLPEGTRLGWPFWREFMMGLDADGQCIGKPILYMGLVMEWVLEGKWTLLVQRLHQLLDEVGVGDAYTNPRLDRLSVVVHYLKGLQLLMGQAEAESPHMIYPSSYLVTSPVRVQDPKDMERAEGLEWVGWDGTPRQLIRKMPGVRQGTVQKGVVPQELVNLRLGVGQLIYMNVDQRVAEFGPTGDVYDWKGEVGTCLSSVKVLGMSTLDLKYQDLWWIGRYPNAEDKYGEGMLLVLPDRAWDSLAWIMQVGVWVLPQFAYGNTGVLLGYQIPSWSGQPLHQLMLQEGRKPWICTGRSKIAKHVYERETDHRKLYLGTVGRGLTTTHIPKGTQALYSIPDVWMEELGARLRQDYDPVMARRSLHTMGPCLEVVEKTVRTLGFPAVWEGLAGRVVVQIKMGVRGYKGTYTFHPYHDPMPQEQQRREAIEQVDWALSLLGWKYQNTPSLDHLVSVGNQWGVDTSRAVSSTEMYKKGYEADKYTMNRAIITPTYGQLWNTVRRVYGQAERVEALCGPAE